MENGTIMPEKIRADASHIEDEAQELARAIYNTFRTADGKVTLTWLLIQCGYFNTKPEDVSPELVALANRLMAAGHMRIQGNAGLYAQAVIESYDNSTFEG